MNSVFNSDTIQKLIAAISAKDGIADKSRLAQQIACSFVLTKDRSVYYNQDFAIRFSSSKRNCSTFSNTVLSLSALQKYDKKPVIVCLVTPEKNYLFLANATFLDKISHSSQELTVQNIKGSFNGSNIMREWAGVKNEPKNFEMLFNSHENYTFEENLVRLVEATNQIAPTGHRFSPTVAQKQCIINAVNRAETFLSSQEYGVLNDDLNARTKAVKEQIIVASLIENVNLRGRCIEYLIASNANDSFRNMVIDALNDKQPLPPIFTDDELGDYDRNFPNDETPVFRTKTDIKTKILFLSSQPKGYNIDKLLSFLATEKSVYLVFIVAIGHNKEISTCLCSMFNRQLLSGTRIISHWAGRNSRGVTQYNGKALEDIVANFDNTIDSKQASKFLELCMKDE